ncbi:translation initiation factor eIF 4e-like domain-containing protein [Scleroderma yunnanense]
MSTQPKNSEDLFPEENPYAWSPASSSSIEEFVSKYKPSIVQNDGTKPWIWVRGKDDQDARHSIEEVVAIAEASELLQKATERVEEIKNDNTIPIRSNKKTGVKSKKEVREQVQSEAAEKLKGISKKYGIVCGKWLIFAPPEKVDVIWASIAKSLVSGPLAGTAALAAKVATSPEYVTPGYQHVICVYLPDVYDKSAVTEVMQVLLRRHGVNLSGVKSDLYTLIGLDSKHLSGIPSTVWKNTMILPDSEIKEEFFSEITAAKTVEKPSDGKEIAPRKPALKKRKIESDDPFASDDDNGIKLQRMSGNREETEKRECGSSWKNQIDSTSKTEKSRTKKRKAST